MIPAWEGAGAAGTSPEEAPGWSEEEAALLGGKAREEKLQGHLTGTSQYLKEPTRNVERDN